MSNAAGKIGSSTKSDVQTKPDYFEGKEGRKHMVESFLQQELVVGIQGNTAIAEKLAKAAKVKFFKREETLYEGWSAANFVCFVLSGSLNLVDDDHKVIAVVENGKL